MPETRGMPERHDNDASVEFTPEFREALRRGLRPVAASVAAQAPIYLTAGYYLTVAPLAFMAARQRDSDSVAVINARLRLGGFLGDLPEPIDHDPATKELERERENLRTLGHPYDHPLDPPAPKPMRQAADPWSADFDDSKPTTLIQRPSPAAPPHLARSQAPISTGARRKDPEALRDASEHAATRWSATHELPKHSRQRPSQTYQGRRERYLRAKAARLGVSINSVRQTTAKRGPRQKGIHP